MEMKILWIALAIFFIIGGFLSLNDSLNTSFIKWVNVGKGVKTNITSTTLNRAKAIGYFLIVVGIVFGIVAWFV